MRTSTGSPIFSEFKSNLSSVASFPMTGQGERLLSVGGCDTLIGIGALSRIRIELDKSPIRKRGLIRGAKSNRPFPNYL